MARGVDQEAPLEPVAGEELLQHQDGEQERREPGHEGGRAAQRGEDDLGADGDPAQDLQVAEGDEAALENPLGIVDEILGVVLVLVEDPQVEEKAEEGQRAEKGAGVVVHPLAGMGKGPRQELVRGVVGGDQHPVAERREALGEVGGDPPGERRFAGQGRFHETKSIAAGSRSPSSRPEAVDFTPEA